MSLSPLEIRANDGEPLDALIHRAIGRDSGAVEAAIAATPGLALIAPALPAGHLVRIPVAAETPAPVPMLQLWD